VENVASGVGGFGLALLVSALLLGLRHGIDWDHIAAISDISASQENRRSALGLGSLYVVGHGAVVFVLGVAAIGLGTTIPPSIEAAMGRVVGVTLIAMGVYVVYSMARHGRDFRLRSRWMLVLSGVRRVYRYARHNIAPRSAAAIAHDHSHSLAVDFHHESEGTEEPERRGRVHSHPHTHGDEFADYTKRTSVGVGMLHGIGAETPTQIVIFLAAANAGGPAAGVVVLAVFLVGLMLSNTAITVASAYGFIAANRNRTVYMAVAGVTGVASLVVGLMFLFGQDSMLPSFFAG